MAIEHLLRRHRFREHPFATWMAEDEIGNIQGWFIKPPFLPTLLGDVGRGSVRPSSDLVFGPRGSGKTALRICLEAALLERAEPVMVLRYTDFSAVLASAPRPSLEAHVEEILRLGTMALIGFLAEVPERAEALTDARRAELAGLVQHYISNLSTDSQRRYAEDLTPRRKRLQAAGRSVVEIYNGVISVLNRERITPVDWRTERAGNPNDNTLPSSRLQRFWDLANSAGLSSIWILVDGLDEAPTTKTPEAILACLAEILLSQRLMEFRTGNTQVMCFKIFMTHPEALRRLLAMEDFRFDRISVHDIGLTHADLNLALSRRLAHFSNDKVLHFDEICESAARGAHDQIVALANKHPRTLFRIAHEVFSQFERTQRQGIFGRNSSTRIR